MLTQNGQENTGMSELSTQEFGAPNSHASALEEQSLTQSSQETSKSLPKSVSMQLVELMKKVTAEHVNPATVRAACECAKTINALLKTNLEMIRRGL